MKKAAAFLSILLLTAAALCLLSCATQPGGDNHSPAIQSFSAEKSVVRKNESILLSVAASDADGDELAYIYEITSGSGDIDENGSTATFTAPDQNGDCIVAVTVYDSYGESDIASIELSITENWGYVGRVGVSEGVADNVQLAINSLDDAFIAYKDDAYGGHLTVKQCAGQFESNFGWEYVGIPGFTDGEVGDIDLYASSSTVYVVFQDIEYDNKISVMKNDFTVSSQWEYLGGRGISPGGGDYVSIGMDSANLLLVSFEDWTEDNAAHIRRYNDVDEVWDRVGTIEFGGGGGGKDYTSLAFKSTGERYIAYSGVDEATGKAVVKRIDALMLTTIGTLGFSDGMIHSPALRTASDDTLYISFTDESTGSRVWVYYFDGSSWYKLFGESVSSGAADFPSMALSSDDTVYVAYRDDVASGKATVMKSGDTAWEPVGDAGFTEGEVWYSEIVLSSAGYPLVAFKDSSVSGRASIVMYW